MTHPTIRVLFGLMVLGRWRSPARTYNLRRAILRRAMQLAASN